MGTTSNGNTLWEAFRSLLISALKVVGLLCAWIFKLTGSGIIYLSSLLFKLSGK